MGNAGHTALLKAIAANDVAAVEACLQSGEIRVNDFIFEYQGLNPLFIAVKECSYAVAARLLDYPDVDFTQRDMRQNSVIMEILEEAIQGRQGAEALAEKLFRKAGKQLLSERDGFKHPLVRLAYMGHLPLVKVLVDMGVHVDGFDAARDTALIAAASAGKHLCVEFLLQHKPDINAHNEKGNNALHSVLRNRTRFPKDGDACAVMLIEAGIDFNCPDNRNMYPIHSAATQGATAVVDALVKKGADIDMLDQYGRTPLILAILRSDEACTGLLLDLGANVNAVKPESASAMEAALKTGNQRIVQLLLEIEEKRRKAKIEKITNVFSKGSSKTLQPKKNILKSNKNNRR